MGRPTYLTTRQWLVLRDGHGCFYCSATGPARIAGAVLFNVDHVIPRARGGCNHTQNKVWSCQPCNTAKADTEPTMELWRPSVIARMHANHCGEIAAARDALGLKQLLYPIR